MSKRKTRRLTDAERERVLRKLQKNSLYGCLAKRAPEKKEPETVPENPPWWLRD